MAIPDFQSFFKPLLDIAADGAEHTVREARERIAKQMRLSEEDLSEMLPSGSERRFDNRVAWAKSFFVQAGVLTSPKRGCFQITDRGRELLAQGHNRIDIKVLNQYPEFREFRTSSGKKGGDQGQDRGTEAETPEESLQSAYESIRADLANALLTKVSGNSPKFFEDLVIDLMLSMGYGGSRADAGKSLGRSGDEGIDGIINEDKLGLDVIYLQAKRWQGSVGRPDLQKFVGALHGRRAKKGVFITTGTFSQEAVRYVENIDPKVILIDGRKMAELMIDHGVGVSTVKTFELKRMDTDYFEVV
ncbi:MAG: restriction endonuclease [Deferrisomatales bacterium]|nr:restriction endonuclease [Deferrisomatales bacterium]